MWCSTTPRRATSEDRRCVSGASTMPPTTSWSPARPSPTTTSPDADPGWDRNAAFFDLVLQDPTLARCKLIAEPWTAAGNDQGQFPPRWSEWNGQYRDVMRDFWRAQVSSPRWVGARIAGSPDMYESHAPRYSLRRQPTASINFITCH